MSESLSILYFYGWWQTVVCLFACLGLLAIWWHLGRKRKDYGQIWLALSIFCWSISGVIEIVFVTKELNNVELLDGLRSITSLFNSLFILLALPWFKYLPAYSTSIIQSKSWHWIIGLPFLFSLLPTLNKLFTGSSISPIEELDVYYSTLTLIFLAGVLWTSFIKRRLPILAYLSLLCVGITFVAQIYKLSDANINMTLFSAIFKSCLIMIFFALALSWIKELSENVIPENSKLHLLLRKMKLENSKMKYLVAISGIPHMPVRECHLSRGNFELLEKFAEAKAAGDQWLEIKPKESTRGQKSYDIKDHNEIKRLLNSILDGLFGKGSWSSENHFIPLKNALFEYSKERPRIIRLQLSPRQVNIEQIKRP